MDAVETKFVTIIAIMILTLGFGLLPYLLILRGAPSSLTAVRRRERALAGLNSFAGGIFLGILLFHIMAEGAEEFERYKEQVDFSSDFPFFNLFVGGGFFFVCFLELIIHSALHKINRTKEVSSPRSSACVEENTQAPFIASVYQEAQDNRYGSFAPSFCERQEHMGNHYHAERTEASHAEPVQVDGVTNTQEHVTCMVLGNPEACKFVAPKITEPSVIISAEKLTLEKVAPGSLSSSSRFPQTVNRTFILLIALSVHTIFDGLVVGIQRRPAEIWTIFAGISLHKTIIAFCLGLEVFKAFTESPCKGFLWMLLFSMMSPVGIFLGMILTSDFVESAPKMLSSSILQGVAAGMFLYITFLEVLSTYIGRHSQNSLLFVMIALLGFGLTAMVQVFELKVGHHHHHGALDHEDHHSH